MRRVATKETVMGWKHAICTFLLVVSFTCFAVAEESAPIRFSCSSQIADALGRNVMERLTEETGIRVNLHVFSSAVALQRLENGFADVVAITTPVSFAMKSAGFVEIPVVRDPMVLVVAKENPVTDLETLAVRRIFAGAITNWKMVNGEDLPIRVVVPCEETGAYQNFDEQVMRMENIRYDFMTYCATTSLDGVTYIPGAISFISQGAAAKSGELKTLKIDGRSPDDVAYPFYQDFRFVTKGKPQGKVRRLIDFAMSDLGIGFMKEKGMRPLVSP